MKKKISIFMCMFALLGVVTISSPAMALQPTVIGADQSEAMGSQPRTDIKEWRYKVMNGNLYKRLYNYSTGHWETDWIFVASGVEEL